MAKPDDLDAQISALQQAVAAHDEAAVAAHLQTIEHALQGMGPLLRGLTYAHVQSVLGRPEKAAAVLDDLAELMPEEAVLHHQLGCYRRAAQDDEGALAAFTRATELDPTRVDAWLERGVLLDARGEAERAVEAYRHVILRAPTEVDAWRNLGNSLAALACYDEAHQAYRTARQLAPGDDTLAFLIASALKAKGELSAANAMLPEALRAELGEAVEVRVEGGGLELRCRFHGPADRRGEHEAAAERLLLAVAEELAEQPEPAFPHGRASGGFVVRQEAWLVLCDRDAIGPGPHRFLDATALVSAAASET